VFRRKPQPERPVGRPWLTDEPRESDIHVVYVRLLDTGQQWRSLRTNRVFDVSFADALVTARIGDRAYLRYLTPTQLAFVRDPEFAYGPELEYGDDI
jgi:hypothetical protein